MWFSEVGSILSLSTQFLGPGPVYIRSKCNGPTYLHAYGKTWKGLITTRSDYHKQRTGETAAKQDELKELFWIRVVRSAGAVRLEKNDVMV
jgi:hypothetical protein